MRDAEIPAFDDLQWLAAFARQLTRDSDEAEDLVQETLLAAWRRPPQDKTGLRPWLATVLRNRLRMERRSEARREARNAGSAAPEEASITPDVAVARVRVLSHLTAELEKLSAEDQQLIVRRFLEGQSAATIASALSVPAGTVRSRIHRLLAGLRERLDERCDGRDAWCAAIAAVPTVGPAAGAQTAAPIARGTHTMLKTTFILSLASTAAVVAYVGLQDTPGADVGTVDNAAIGSDVSARVAAVDSASESTAKADPQRAEDRERGRLHWQKTKAAVERQLKANPPTVPAPSKTSTRGEYARLVMACVKDIEDQPAKFSLKITEVGAPDVGTIVSHAEVVDASISNPEIIECAEQSMYAYEGPAPSVAFERSFRMGLRTAPKRSAEQLEIRLHFYMDANFAQVRACEPDGIKGKIELDVTSDELGKVTKVDIAESTVDAATSKCIADAASSWTFPEPVTLKTTRHRYVLPIHDLQFSE